MRPVKIAVIADWYCAWMGGASILASFLNGLLRAASAQESKIYVLMNSSVLSVPADLQGNSYLRVRRETISAGGPFGLFIESSPLLEDIHFYSDLNEVIKSLGIDVIGPTGQDLGTRVACPWFSYIPDFQHQYLPEFFSQRERAARDFEFRNKIENSAGVFVNSAAVAADLKRFYPGAVQDKRIIRFPTVYPEVSAGMHGSAEGSAKRHGIAHPYLISCSQRWLHKQHEFIVGAFAEFLRARPDSPLRLVFTGERADHRDPDYDGAVEALIDRLGLRSRVYHLGLVPRPEQLMLIRSARAIVQASLFEGGPGASGTMEAALLGTPVLASDIDVNRELQFGNVRWFNPHNIASLAKLIQSVDSPGIDPVRSEPFNPQEIEVLTLASGLATMASLRSAAG